MYQQNQEAQNLEAIKQKIVQHVKNRQKIKKIYKDKGIQMIDKPELLFSEIINPQLKIEQTLVYVMMQNELREKGFDEFRFLGQGAQGFVLLGKKNSSNSRYAIKGINFKDAEGKFIKDGNGEDLLTQANKEIEMLKKCQGSPYVINLLDVIEGEQFLYLIFNECLGTMSDIIEQIQSKKLNELSAIKYAKDIAEGLLYIHSQKCLMNDLKLQNILIDSNGNAVISDLGLADNLAKTYGHAINQHLGNVAFRAPECYNPAEFDEYYKEYQKLGIVVESKPSIASEAFSLGYLIYVMISGFNFKLLLKKQKPLKYSSDIQQFTYYKELKFIIDGLTQFIPEKRLRIRDVLKLLNEILSFQFQSDQIFFEIMNGDESGIIQKQMSQLQQNIEFVQYDAVRFYPIIKNELGLIQQFSPNNVELEQKYEQIIAQLKNSNEFLAKSLQEKVKEISDLQTNYETTIGKLKESNDQQAQKIKQQDHFISELQATTARSQQSNQSLTQQVKDKDTFILDLQVKQEATITELNELNGLNESLRKIIQDKEQMIFSLNQKWEATVEELNKQITSLSQQINEKDDTIQALQQQILLSKRKKGYLVYWKNEKYYSVYDKNKKLIGRIEKFQSDSKITLLDEDLEKVIGNLYTEKESFFFDKSLAFKALRFFNDEFNCEYEIF